ncbi:hypothetical protein PSPO01_08067 [Paraphaeosphaeria sporulosa]
MVPHAVLLPGKLQELLDAINHVAREDPNLKTGDLGACSELWQSSPRIYYRRPRSRKELDTREEGNDSDDDDDDYEERKGAYSLPLPTPLFTASRPPHTLPFRYKPDTQAVPSTPTTITSPVPFLLLTGSDGLRDTRAPILFSGAPLSDIQTAIHAAIPAHTALCEARINHNCDNPKSHSCPTTPSSSGSPRHRHRPTTPTPTNEQLEEATRAALSRARTASLPRPTRLPVHTRSETPACSRSRPRKQRRTAPTGPAPYQPDSDDGDRGRSRTRPVISRPMLQHPIAVAGVEVGEGRPGGSGSSLHDSAKGDIGGVLEAGRTAARRRGRARDLSRERRARDAVLRGASDTSTWEGLALPSESQPRGTAAQHVFCTTAESDQASS